MDAKKTLEKVFDKKNPIGRLLGLSVTVIAAGLLLHFIINASVDVEKYERGNPIIDLFAQPTLNDSTVKIIAGFGREALLTHLYETNQIDTIYIDFDRLNHIQDSLVKNFFNPKNNRP